MNKFYNLFSVAILAVFGLSATVPSFFVEAKLASGFVSKTMDAPSAQSVGFYLNGRYLFDANGNNFVMRGINYPHTWFPIETSSFANIKTRRANTIRVVLSNGKRWTKNSATDVANVINLCKTNKLICVLEVHDTTGYGEQAGAASLAEAVNYWKEIKSVLIGQEAYVIINIGNEPYGNNNMTNWITDTKNAVLEMRSAGFQHMLMVDAPNWGQDWEFIMRDNAADVFASDPNGNVVFSIHMYGVFDTEEKAQNYISAFVNAGLPLVIGEFAHQHTDGDPNEDAIMSIAQSNGIGYLGWSWSGNSAQVQYLDMVTNFDPSQMTWWGNRIINGENGITQSSRQASVYGIFEDVPTDYWAWDFVERLYNAGITGGCSTVPLQYCPEANVTRAQMAVFLEKGLHNSSFTAPAVPITFGDTSGHWAQYWIEALKSDGITAGCGAGNYCPENSTTRAEMAVFLLRAKHGAGYTPPAVGASTGFNDVPTNHWAATWIKQLAAEGITGGCGTNLYCPGIPVTRAQMAVFLVRTFNLP